MIIDLGVEKDHDHTVVSDKLFFNCRMSSFGTKVDYSGRLFKRVGNEMFSI